MIYLSFLLNEQDVLYCCFLYVEYNRCNYAVNILSLKRHEVLSFRPWYLYVQQVCILGQHESLQDVSKEKKADVHDSSQIYIKGAFKSTSCWLSIISELLWNVCFFSPFQHIYPLWSQFCLYLEVLPITKMVHFMKV